MLRSREMWTAFAAFFTSPSPTLRALLLAAFACLLRAPGCHGDAGICAAPGAGWEATHLQDIGICLYSETMATRGAKYNYSESVTRCKYATQTSGLTRLPRMDSEQKKVRLVNALLEKAFGYMNLWTEAYCDSATSRFVWSSGSPISPEQSCSFAANPRLYFSSSVVDWSLVSSFIATNDTSQTFIPVCEYGVPQCDPRLIPGYNNATMRLSTVPYANQTVHFDCAPGYYRPSEIVLVGGKVDKAASADNNLFFCLFEPGSGAGTSAFVQIGSGNPLEGCQPSSCQGWQLINTTTIPDVEDYTAVVNASKNYRFGEKINLVCRNGYVSATDEMLTTATLMCGQSDLNPSLGMWMPATLVVCTAVRCKMAMPFYDSDNMIAYKAFDRHKDRTYTSDETNRFPYYPNEVSIRCRHEGNFFMDRTYDKSLTCDLPGNGTNNSAIWFPFGGTVLSNDVMKCQPITCLTKEIVIVTQQGDLLGYLSRSNFNDSLIITKGEVVSTVTIRQFTTIASLDYGTRVRFHCDPKHQMSAPSESGQSQLVNTTEVVCASTGTWSFRVSSCIKQTESVGVTGTGRKYVPPAQEAAGASSLGLVVIIILIVFFSTILILDLTTIARDVKLLRTNLRRIKLKIQQRKQS